MPSQPLQEFPRFPSDAVKTKSRFWECYTCFGCETKTGVVRALVIFQGLCSAISFERSRRELFIDVAKHGSMLKNYQNTLYACFSFIFQEHV